MRNAFCSCVVSLAVFAYQPAWAGTERGTGARATPEDRSYQNHRIRYRRTKIVDAAKHYAGHALRQVRQILSPRGWTNRRGPNVGLIPLLGVAGGVGNIQLKQANPKRDVSWRFSVIAPQYHRLRNWLTRDGNFLLSQSQGHGGRGSEPAQRTVVQAKELLTVVNQYAPFFEPRDPTLSPGHAGGEFVKVSAYMKTLRTALARMATGELSGLSFSTAERLINAIKTEVTSVHKAYLHLKGHYHVMDVRHRCQRMERELFPALDRVMSDLVDLGPK